MVVTSTNAKQIVESFPKAEKIIFGPDRNLGNYINSSTGRNMLVWDGACHVHAVSYTHLDYRRIFSLIDIVEPFWPIGFQITLQDVDKRQGYGSRWRELNR